MADFLRALPFVLLNEGGWSDDPSDPGGATNYGITLAAAQRHGVMDKDALRSITPALVASIYREDYWRFDGVNDQRVATKVFDMRVNMDHAAIHILQEALSTLGATLALDGVYGPATEAAVNAVRADRLIEQLCLESAEHYQAIVVHRPASAKFLKGWLVRAAAVPV